MSEDINIRDIGPVTNLGIRFKPQGGVTEILGSNGSGKTTTVEAVKALATGKGQLSKRDGALSGAVEAPAWQARIGVRARTQHTGDAEIVTLEGKFDISDLVDPKLKDGIAADTKRIKALLSLSGAKPDVSIFYEIAGGQAAFEQLVDADSLKSADLVALAAKVQRGFHEAARQAESLAEHEEGHARGKLEIAGQFTGDKALTSEEAHEQLNRAIGVQAQVKERYEAGSQRALEAQEAQAKIEEFKAKGGIGSADALKQKMDSLLADALNLETKIERMALELANLRTAHTRKKQEIAETSKEVDHYKQQAAILEEWEKTVAGFEAGKTHYPTQDMLDEADRVVAAAKEFVNEAALAAQARRASEEASIHTKAAKDQRLRAAQLRQAATSVDDVLSQQVAKISQVLRVKEQRLVTATERGEDTLFAELSPGERTKIALDCAMEVLGANGLVTLDQEVWTHLDPDNQAMADQRAAEIGLHLLAPRATRGPLRCVPFGETDPWQEEVSA